MLTIFFNSSAFTQKPGEETYLSCNNSILQLLSKKAGFKTTLPLNICSHLAEKISYMNIQTKYINYALVHMEQP